MQDNEYGLVRPSLNPACQVLISDQDYFIEASLLTDFWSAESVGDRYLAFNNPTGTALWIHAAYRADQVDEFITIEPPVRVGPGRTTVIDMYALVNEAVPSEYASRFWNEIGIAVARVGGRWTVVQP